uniref:Coiled-coil-helix-coiled-coil-helix domain containing 3 n=1 Tax=Oryctolagus cuniculus TaxID=9986 RepID=A0A5F9CZM2_RABIT
MGGTASTRRVTFEADENENITVVKGIRLSENVIDRMKESSPSGSRSQRHSGVYGASVSDEELKRRVAEELALEQAKKESETQKRLKQDKELERERAAASEQLTRAILRERVASEEERAKAKHLAKQLEEKDRVIKKQDAFYKEQLARLEERSSEFYKVTTEQYQKAAEEVEAKFNRALEQDEAIRAGCQRVLTVSSLCKPQAQLLLLSACGCTDPHSQHLPYSSSAAPRDEPVLFFPSWCFSNANDDGVRGKNNITGCKMHFSIILVCRQAPDVVSVLNHGWFLLGWVGVGLDASLQSLSYWLFSGDLFPRLVCLRRSFRLGTPDTQFSFVWGLLPVPSSMSCVYFLSVLM